MMEEYPDDEEEAGATTPAPVDFNEIEADSMEEVNVDVDVEMAALSETIDAFDKTIGTSAGAAKSNKNDDDDVNKEEDETLSTGTASHNGSIGNKMASSPPSLGRLLRLAKPEAVALIMAIMLMIFSEGAGLVNPMIVARAYDALVAPDATNEEKLSEIHLVMGMVLLLHFAGVVAGFLRSAILGIAGERVVARLRNSLYSSILRQEIAFFDDHKSGELVSRLSSDTTLIQSATSLSMPEALLGLIKVIVAVSLMFWISLKLAALTIGSVFLIFVMAVPFGRILGRLSKAYQDTLGQAQTRSTEALSAPRTVQSFAAEDRERQRYSDKIGNPDDFPCWLPKTGKKSDTNKDARTTTSNTNNDGNDEDDGKTTYSVGFNKSIWNAAFFSGIFGFGFGAMYLSLWYGFSLVVAGEITLGQLTAFQSYIFQIGFGLGSVSGHVSKVLEALGASGRIFYLLDRIPTIPTPPVLSSASAESNGKGDIDKTRPSKASTVLSSTVTIPPPLIQPESMVGAVTLQNVTFAYPSRPNAPVLQNVSLVVPPNTTAALVGSSGGGKSTVVNLLQRFYDVQDGSIQIDGHDIRTLDLPWLRRHIGYVQQEPTLFGVTVRENVCYGADAATTVSQEEMEGVCRLANAHDFIMNMPDGYDTLVGERGVKLSGGQKQRIAIARALLVNPSILLLDEATSALDAESEHLVQEAIEKAVVGRTVLIVAHRLSTIQRADQIVVLDDNNIADVGSHQALLRRCSKYQDLIQRQSVVFSVGDKLETIEDTPEDPMK